MRLFEIDAKTKFEPSYFLDAMFGQIQGAGFDEILQTMANSIESKQEVPLSIILDLVIPYIKESDFVLKKRYVIKDAVRTAFGKWP
jgi:hypothetical protein